MKKLYGVLAGLALAAFLGIAAHKVSANVDLTASGNNMPDTQCFTWGGTSNSQLCASSAGNYLRLFVNAVSQLGINATGVGIGINAATAQLHVVPTAGTVGLLVNTPAGPTADVAQFQANGVDIVEVGGYASGSEAALVVTPLNASTTAFMINTPASPTANIASFQVNAATVTVVGPQGHFGPQVYRKLQYDTIVPDAVGTLSVCVDCNFTFNLCMSTGSLKGQYQALFISTGGFIPTNASISGSGTRQNGCGSGQ